MIAIKRVYEPPAAGDGYRVLVDRLWPRGVSREAATIDLWLKDIAPSNALRLWFGKDPARWAEFAERYVAELEAPEAAPHLRLLRARAKVGLVTLLYAKRDETENNARVLRNFLMRWRG